MTRKEREFFARPLQEQEWMLKNTWCNRCKAADLGMQNPKEYEINGTVYIEGYCVKCGERVVSAVEDIITS